MIVAGPLTSIGESDLAIWNDDDPDFSTCEILDFGFAYDMIWREQILLFHFHNSFMVRNAQIVALLSLKTTYLLSRGIEA